MKTLRTRGTRQLGPRGRATIHLAPLVAAVAIAGVVLMPSAGAVVHARALGVVKSPNRGGVGSVLNAATCVSAMSCFAVGHWISPGSFDKTLVEESVKGSWRELASPNASANDNNLTSVACASAATCFAVGYHDGPSWQQTAVERWNGRQWLLAASPNAGTMSNQLSGIACATPYLCFAVGRYEAPFDHTLVEMWHASRWVTTPSPSPGGGVGSDNSLSAVSCPSKTLCFAVGTGGVGNSEALIERWNGHGWVLVANPPANGTISALTAVSCPSVSFCVAAGYDKSTGTEQSLIERWNGKAWTKMTARNVGVGNNAIESMSCFRGSLCEGADSYQAGSVYQTVVLRWGGHGGWVVVNAPRTGAQGTSLYGAACVSAELCVHVGEYQPATIQRTLVLQGR